MMAILGLDYFYLKKINCKKIPATAFKTHLIFENAYFIRAFVTWHPLFFR
jgi:hypothetical protein